MMDMQYSIFAGLYLFFILGLFILVIYTLISFISFMKRKQKSDRELNDKLTVLIEEIRSK
ncbi:hypothetical protein [Pseudalkalibacillus salsuginis]|uniref:hypothetical protein n=1 Tax=Pseudalkalibacillus salsuginis TaxID=2910972 RepID=UPI001F4815DD|nr:hypothetical protein [Pseudalkalibacillus salsuginis]MCF6411177.1 hypothetical protein [Pseudalkalibacillus salsuginis]